MAEVNGYIVNVSISDNLSNNGGNLTCWMSCLLYIPFNHTPCVCQVFIDLYFVHSFRMGDLKTRLPPCIGYRHTSAARVLRKTFDELIDIQSKAVM